METEAFDWSTKTPRPPRKVIKGYKREAERSFRHTKNGNLSVVGPNYLEVNRLYVRLRCVAPAAPWDISRVCELWFKVHALGFRFKLRYSLGEIVVNYCGFVLIA